MSSMHASGPDPSLQVTRVRHELKARRARVKQVRALTPHLVRVTFEGADLRDFESASFDDHVKVMFPAPGSDDVVLPTPGPEGPVFPGGVRPLMRDYTPRRYDRASGELDIEFVLHEAGPATRWAANAAVGQSLGFGGPRGSFIIPVHFDWHLLIGDDTALPAIARRLEELPRGARAIVIAEVAEPAARVEFSTRADLDLTWCFRSADPGDALLAALRTAPPLPAGEGYAWAAAESSVARLLRRHLTEERAIDKSRIRAAAYWKRGAQAIHEVVDD